MAVNNRSPINRDVMRNGYLLPFIVAHSVIAIAATAILNTRTKNLYSLIEHDWTVSIASDGHVGPSGIGHLQVGLAALVVPIGVGGTVVGTH